MSLLVSEAEAVALGEILEEKLVKTEERGQGSLCFRYTEGGKEKGASEVEGTTQVLKVEEDRE